MSLAVKRKTADCLIAGRGVEGLWEERNVVSQAEVGTRPLESRWEDIS